jgi:hypothetical protein
MFTLVRITESLAPVELSPTHCPRADLDVSLKDFPPASSEAVLLLLPWPPSPVFVFRHSYPFLHEHFLGDWKKNSRKQKSSQIIIVWHNVTGGAIGAHIIWESGLSLCVSGPRIQSKTYCICQFPNLINYHQQTLHYQQLVDITDGLIISWLTSKNPEMIRSWQWIRLSLWTMRPTRLWRTSLTHPPSDALWYTRTSAVSL